jgi:hypothetical protein
MSLVGSRWTDEEEEKLLDCIAKGMRNNEIAVTLDRKPGGISARIRVIAYKLFMKNVPILDICKQTRLTQRDVHEVIHRREVNDTIDTNDTNDILQKRVATDIQPKIGKSDNILLEIKSMQSDISELKRDVKELITLLHSIYEFEE